MQAERERKMKLIKISKLNDIKITSYCDWDVVEAIYDAIFFQDSIHISSTEKFD